MTMKIGMPASLLHDFNVSKVTHPHLKRWVASVRFNPSGDSDDFPVEMLDRLDAEFHELVCGLCQPGGELAAVMEKDVVDWATEPPSGVRHRFDRSDLELHGDFLFWPLLDGLFRGQHLLLLLAVLRGGFLLRHGSPLLVLLVFLG